MKSNKERISSKRRKERELKVMALFSIYLMISLTVCSAYAFRQYDGVQSTGTPLSEMLIEFLNFLIPSVSAAGCCVLTISGEYCKENVESTDCRAGYWGGSCSDAPNQACGKGTCIRQNGDCDALVFKEKCEDDFGTWYSEPFLSVPACMPTCYIYTKNNYVVDAEWVFFRNKGEKSPLVTEQKLDYFTEDISYDACQDKILNTTRGYCTIKSRADCEYMSKGECDVVGGDFSSQKCASCSPNKTKQDYNGEDGYGVYWFDSCNGPGQIIENCEINEIVVENSAGELHCEPKVCSVDIKFTNLNYDTAYLKKGQVEIEGPFGLRIEKAGPNFKQNLRQGENACVRFQGPGEQQYHVTCQLGELMVFGTYPNLMSAPDKIQKQKILEELTHSYLLKDILEIERVKGSKILLDLLRLIAFQVGSEVSISELASRIGIDAKTAGRYLDLFEKSFVLYNLRGFSRNLRKEITKKSKYYFYDNGIRNAIIRNYNSIGLRNDVGALWENFLAIERIKKCAYAPIFANRFFWRTYDQKEIDYIEEREGKLFAYEFKWGKGTSPVPTDFLKAYPNAEFKLINQNNYYDFVG